MLSFKAPATSPLSGSEPYIDEALFKDFPTYTSLKFRPAEGNTEEASVACACAFPMMRYEEMFFIAAEAAARLGDAGTAKTILTKVMSTRNPNYNCKASSPEDVAEEVFLQKRIEFFGEGITFFDYKRLNKSVDRTASSNWDVTENYKIEGRPAWMVFKGQGDIRDFPGNYSDYRDWREAKEQRDKEAEKPKEEKTARVRLNDKRKMSFKEKKEFEQLEQEIAGLEQEKADIEAALCSGTLGVEELTEKSKRLPELNDLIDEKTMRWLELSEIEG